VEHDITCKLTQNSLLPLKGIFVLEVRVFNVHCSVLHCDYSSSFTTDLLLKLQTKFMNSQRGDGYVI